MFNLSRRITVRDISIISVLTAVCIAGNYILIGIPNVKIMDLIAFSTGFVFGSYIGALTGALAWAVYGVINPYGFSLPILWATMAGEAMFGAVGGLVGKTKPSMTNVFKFSVEMALWGFILSASYDLLTNIVFAFTFGASILQAIVTGWLMPPWFGFLHEASNTILFLSAVRPTVKAIERGRRGETNE